VARAERVDLLGARAGEEILPDAAVDAGLGSDAAEKPASRQLLEPRATVAPILPRKFEFLPDEQFRKNLLSPGYIGPETRWKSVR
jgi:hypothetical protein